MLMRVFMGIGGCCCGRMGGRVEGKGQSRQFELAAFYFFKDDLALRGRARRGELGWSLWVTDSECSVWPQD